MLAMIVAVDMEDLHPMHITFRQLPTLIEYENGPCEAIDNDWYFCYKRW